MGSPGTRRTGTCCRRCSSPISTPAGRAPLASNRRPPANSAAETPVPVENLDLVCAAVSRGQHRVPGRSVLPAGAASPAAARARPQLPPRAGRTPRPRQGQVRQACRAAGPPPGVAELNCSGFGGPMGVPDRVRNTKPTYSNPPRISPWHAGFRVMPLTGPQTGCRWSAPRTSHGRHSGGGGTASPSPAGRTAVPRRPFPDRYPDPERAHIGITCRSDRAPTPATGTLRGTTKPIICRHAGLIRSASPRRAPPPTPLSCCGRLASASGE